MRTLIILHILIAGILHVAWTQTVTNTRTVSPQDRQNLMTFQGRRRGTGGSGGTITSSGSGTKSINLGEFIDDKGGKRLDDATGAIVRSNVNDGGGRTSSGMLRTNDGSTMSSGVSGGNRLRLGAAGQGQNQGRTISVGGANTGQTRLGSSQGGSTGGVLGGGNLVGGGRGLGVTRENMGGNTVGEAGGQMGVTGGNVDSNRFATGARGLGVTRQNVGGNRIDDRGLGLGSTRQTMGGNTLTDGGRGLGVTTGGDIGGTRFVDGGRRPGSTRQNIDTNTFRDGGRRVGVTRQNIGGNRFDRGSRRVGVTRPNMVDRNRIVTRRRPSTRRMDSSTFGGARDMVPRLRETTRFPSRRNQGMPRRLPEPDRSFVNRGSTRRNLFPDTTTPFMSRRNRMRRPTTRFDDGTMPMRRRATRRQNQNFDDTTSFMRRRNMGVTQNPDFMDRTPMFNPRRTSRRQSPSSRDTTDMIRRGNTGARMPNWNDNTTPFISRRNTATQSPDWMTNTRRFMPRRRTMDRDNFDFPRSDRTTRRRMDFMDTTTPMMRTRAPVDRSMDFIDNTRFPVRQSSDWTDDGSFIVGRNRGASQFDDVTHRLRRNDMFVDEAPRAQPRIGNTQFVDMPGDSIQQQPTDVGMFTSTPIPFDTPQRDLVSSSRIRPAMIDNTRDIIDSRQVAPTDMPADVGTTVVDPGPQVPDMVTRSTFIPRDTQIDARPIVRPDDIQSNVVMPRQPNVPIPLPIDTERITDLTQPGGPVQVEIQRNEDDENKDTRTPIVSLTNTGPLDDKKKPIVSLVNAKGNGVIGLKNPRESPITNLKNTGLPGSPEVRLHTTMPPIIVRTELPKAPTFPPAKPVTTQSSLMRGDVTFEIPDWPFPSTDGRLPQTTTVQTETTTEPTSSEETTDFPTTIDVTTMGTWTTQEYTTRRPTVPLPTTTTGYTPTIFPEVTTTADPTSPWQPDSTPIGTTAFIPTTTDTDDSGETSTDPLIPPQPTTQVIPPQPTTQLIPATTDTDDSGETSTGTGFPTTIIPEPPQTPTFPTPTTMPPMTTYDPSDSSDSDDSDESDSDSTDSDDDDDDSDSESDSSKSDSDTTGSDSDSDDDSSDSDDDSSDSSSGSKSKSSGSSDSDGDSDSDSDSGGKRGKRKNKRKNKNKGGRRRGGGVLGDSNSGDNSMFDDDMFWKVLGGKGGGMGSDWNFWLDNQNKKAMEWFNNFPGLGGGDSSSMFSMEAPMSVSASNIMGNEQQGGVDKEDRDEVIEEIDNTMDEMYFNTKSWLHMLRNSKINKKNLRRLKDFEKAIESTYDTLSKRFFEMPRTSLNDNTLSSGEMPLGVNMDGSTVYDTASTIAYQDSSEK